MKLNFWQWLAILLLIVGCAIWAYERHEVAKAPFAPAHSTVQTR